MTEEVKGSRRVAKLARKRLFGEGREADYPPVVLAPREEGKAFEMPKYEVRQLTEAQEREALPFKGKFTSDGTYEIPELYNQDYGVMLAVRQPNWSVNQNPDLGRWKALAASKIATLKGRVEISNKVKRNPRVKFVRSGKRWGVIIG